MISKRLTFLTVTAASGVAVALAGPASAAGAPTQLQVTQTVSSDYIGPLQFAVDGSKIYVADSATSTLNLVGSPTPLAKGPDPTKGGDLAGVGVDPLTGAVAYTTTNSDHSKTRLYIRQAGHPNVVADLSTFERLNDPDQVNHYGTNSTDPCVVNGLTSAGLPVKYSGGYDSHPYAVASLGNGNWAVADAGGNDILKVDSTGAVSLLSVLPAVPVVINQATADQNGLPSCVVGITYRFEPVPTDVEVSPTGVLYATSLPGGPEGPDSGNPGSVYRITSSGSAAKVATGFAGATNMAFDPQGGIYVAEIGSGTISKVVQGHPVQVLSLPGVVAVEYGNGHLYASTAPAVTGGSDPGSIYQLGPATG